MYISAHRSGDKVYVWERHSEDGRVCKEYTTPYYFYVNDDNGKEISLFDEHLTKHVFDNNEDFQNAKNSFKQTHKLFESDINPIYKILNKYYYQCKAPNVNVSFIDIETDYKSKSYPLNQRVDIRNYVTNQTSNVTIEKLRTIPTSSPIEVFDVELNKWCSIEQSPYWYDGPTGFSSVANPYAPINAIAIHHYWMNKSIVYAIPPKGWKEKLDPTLLNLSEIVLCKDEKQLLKLMLDQFKNTDILSGWNSKFFDIPYICKRIELVLGKKFLRDMSFDRMGLPRFQDVEVFGNIQQKVNLVGLIDLDYMDLLKKYDTTPRASYKLETISEDLLPGLEKLSYPGTLEQLYRNDFNFFLRYNIRDCEILRGLEDKLGFVKLANMMTHMSTAQFPDVFGTLMLTEASFVAYSHHVLNRRIPDYQEKEDYKIQGAYVLFPQVGEHEWVGSVDANSLYPSAIRTVNISPETLIAQFDTNEDAFRAIRDKLDVDLTLTWERTQHRETKTAIEWGEYLVSIQAAISGYGTVYDQTRMGCLPALLTDWYKNRKINQAEMKRLEKIANNIRLEYDSKKLPHVEGQTVIHDNVVFPKEIGDQYNKYVEDADFYNLIQHALKIRLNSSYGALANKFFVLNDRRLAESVTATGRNTLEHICRKTNQVLGGEYDVDLPLEKQEFDPDGWEKESTDLEDDLSVDVKIGTEKRFVLYGDTDSCYFATTAENVDDAVKIADMVENKVNKSMDKFATKAFLCQPNFLGILRVGREIVAKKAIFIQKKRYLAYVVDKEGKRVDQIKMMGVDVKKTTIPKHVSKKLTDLLFDVLKGRDWKAIDTDIVDFKQMLKTVDVFNIGLPKGVKKVEHYTEQYELLGIKARLPGHVAASIHYNKCLEEYQDTQSMPICSNMKIKVFYTKQKRGKFTSIALPTDIDKLPPWFVEHYVSDIDTTKHIDRLVDKPMGNIFKAIDRIVPSKQSMFVDDCLIY